MQRPNSEQIFKRAPDCHIDAYADDGDDDACFKGIFEALSALLKIGILLCSLPLADEVKLQAPNPQLCRAYVEPVALWRQ